MACAEKQKTERLKVLQHAKVLTCQRANLERRTLAVVKLIHHCYGEYYDGIDYEKAKAEKRRIFKKYSPGDSMAI